MMVRVVRFGRVAIAQRLTARTAAIHLGGIYQRAATLRVRFDFFARTIVQSVACVVDASKFEGGDGATAVIDAIKFNDPCRERDRHKCSPMV